MKKDNIDNADGPIVAESSKDLSVFIEQQLGPDAMRIEEDFGYGYVRLKSSEAEKRQAAQDIRSTEDIVIEMLRNSRDAGAKNIFLAISREGDYRRITVIDNGSGIPQHMHENIFKPRVTSKLDSARMDKWGIHGRGMALYSIAVNSKSYKVARSEVGQGSSITVVTDATELPEKKDQSTFPYFEEVNGTFSMRGPKNILRTVCEFAIEHREDVSVYCGSPVEIASTLYHIGQIDVPASKRVFKTGMDDSKLTDLLGYAVDSKELAELAASIGIDISQRSARRIIDGDVVPVKPMLARIEDESFPKRASEGDGRKETAKVQAAGSKVKMSQDDAASIARAALDRYREIAPRYYLDGEIEADVRQRAGCLLISIPIVEH